MTEAVVVNYFKLMAYKDEYEVSRLYTNSQFKNNIYDNFEGDFSINFHISPPFLSKKDPVTGEPLKITIGSWLLPLMKILSSFKFLRGTPFDPFGYLKERRKERKLIKDFYSCIIEITDKLTITNYDLACKIASLPQKIRGFGHIKENNINVAKNIEKILIAKFDKQ